MARKPLAELLLDSALLDRSQLRLALNHQRLHGRPLGHTVVQLGLVHEDTLMQVLAEQLHLPVAEPDRVPPEEAALGKLDAAFCQRHGCIPLRLDPRGDRLDVAFADPTVSELVDLIHVKTHCAVLPHLAAPSVIDQAIRQAYLGEPRRGTGGGHARQQRTPTGPLAPPSTQASRAIDPAPRSGTKQQWPATEAPRSVGRRVTGPTPLVASSELATAPAVPTAAEPAGPAMPPGRPAMRPELIRAGAAQTAAARQATAAGSPIPLAPPRTPPKDDARIGELQGEVAKLTREMGHLKREASELRVLLERDEKVLQRLLGLLVDRGVCSRDQLVARLYEEH